MDAWPRCLERLEAEFPIEDVHTWLKPLQASMREDGFVLYAPNAFVMEEVRARYLARIRELLAHFAGSGEVSLEIGSHRRVVPGNGTAPTRPRVTAMDALRSSRLSRAISTATTASTTSSKAAATSLAVPLPGRRRRNPATALTIRCCCTAAPDSARPI